MKMSIQNSFGRINCFHRTLLYTSFFSKVNPYKSLISRKNISFSSRSEIEQKFPSVGVAFDIDGVILRGRSVIKSAKKALEKLENYKVPYVYLTNSGCETEECKAKALEKHLSLEVDPEQIVLSHSPLRALNRLHDKHILVCGQGPISEVARECGFSKVFHIDDVDNQFPELNVNDKIKQKNLPPASGKPFSPIEAIVLMGEPLNWEKSIQIIVDVILSNSGFPNKKHPSLNQQIPVVAVNTDFLWMSESANPRFGHGAFLLCLESVFKKLTGRDLEYSAVLGKPNLSTYLYTTDVLLKFACKRYLQDRNLKTLYAVGDNPATDIYGANVYHSYLKNPTKSTFGGSMEEKLNSRVQRMKSILVETGVYESEAMETREDVNHLHRDTLYCPQFSNPTYICKDVFEAVETILNEEGIC